MTLLKSSFCSLMDHIGPIVIYTIQKPMCPSNNLLHSADMIRCLNNYNLNNLWCEVDSRTVFKTELHILPLYFYTDQNKFNPTIMI